MSYAGPQQVPLFPPNEVALGLMHVNFKPTTLIKKDAITFLCFRVFVVLLGKVHVAGLFVTCVQGLLILTSGFREIRHGRCFVGNTGILWYAFSEVEGIAALSTDQYLQIGFFAM